MTSTAPMIYVNVQQEQVPALGFGTWQLTGQACVNAVADALAIGYRHIDTAQGYDNEVEVGRGMRGGDVERDAVFLTTKVWRDRFTRDKLPPSVDDSLGKLGTDYIDLLLLHWPSADVPLEETLDAMRLVQDQGKVRHIGLSNYPPSQVRRAQQHATIFCNQVEYHPYLSQDALLALARETNHMIAAYSPVARGHLLDDPTLKAVADAHAKTVVQVALRWLVQQDHVCAIPKAATPAHRRSNFEIFDFELSAEEMHQIAALDQELRVAPPPWAPDWER
ncbi:MAG: aldo/keto reductase [Phycisphaeraceae bacterium]